MSFEWFYSIADRRGEVFASGGAYASEEAARTAGERYFSYLSPYTRKHSTLHVWKYSD